MDKFKNFSIFNVSNTYTKTRPRNMQPFFTAVKMIIFRLKIVIFFLVIAQNIDCGYTLEPHQSNEYPQSND